MLGVLPIGALPIGGAPAAAAVAEESFTRITILSPREFDAATLAATSQVDSLPVVNIQNQRPTKVYRTTTTETYITVTFASDIAANMLAVRHKMGPEAVGRVWLADTVENTVVAPQHDTGWQSLYPPSGKPNMPDMASFYSALTWSNDNLWPCARIGLADPSSSGHFDICRVTLGRGWRPDHNYDFDGIPLGRIPKDVQTETDYGQVFTDRRGSPRHFRLSLSAASEDEIYDGLDEIQRLRGLWGDVWVFLDLGADQRFQKMSMQGLFTLPSEFQVRSAFGGDGRATFTTNIAVREAI